MQFILSRYPLPRKVYFLILLTLPATWLIIQWLVRPSFILSPISVDKATVREALGQLPLLFIPNTGQTHPNVRFYVRSLGGTLFFSETELVLSLPSSKPKNNSMSPDIPLTASSVLHIQFEGANPAPYVKGGKQAESIVSHFRSSDPAKWHTNVPTYADLSYSGLYPGIDLTYEGSEGQLKSTYLVTSYADPTQIRWRYIGADHLSIDSETGDLLIEIVVGKGKTYTLCEKAPTAWQEINGERTPVEASYTIAADNGVSFLLGAYDPAYSLVIDPVVLAYSTYLGGSSDETGLSIAIDEADNVYVTGITYSFDFPVQNGDDSSLGGFEDAFITKLDVTAGTLIYSTYLGGSSGDYGTDITVDNVGNVYVTGYTTSSDFPMQNAYDASYNGSADVFIAKLDPTGSTLLYSTYLGGSNFSFESGVGIAVDSAGNAYVTGQTNSPNFPTQNAYDSSYNSGDDVFVTKLNADGNTLIYSTYLGGSNNEYSYDIAVDSAGNAYLTGRTHSTNFPTQNAYDASHNGGVRDVFVSKLGPDGSSLVFSTYLGGSSYDQGEAIAVDDSGNAYITGITYSTDFPTQNAFDPSHSGGYEDAFVTKLGVAGNTLAYSTYLGGAGDDQGRDIVVDSAGHAYITGLTTSTDFPIRNASDPNQNGFADAFVTKLNVAGNTLVYSTYVGGGDQDLGVGIAVNNIGNTYVTGRTVSANFPTLNAYDPDWNSGEDAFVIKIIQSPLLSLTTTVDDANPVPNQRITYTITIENRGNDATNAVVSDALPSSLTFAAPINVEPPDMGTIGTPPILLSSLAISTNQLITLTFPVTVNTGLMGGTKITNVAAITSAEITAPITDEVGITIVNVPPKAVDDTFTTPEDLPIILTVLNNDTDPNNDPIIVSSVGTPNNGTATINEGTSITYTPILNFAGTDVFTYTISDGNLYDVATITVNVLAQDWPTYLPLIVKH